MKTEDREYLGEFKNTYGQVAALRKMPNCRGVLLSAEEVAAALEELAHLRRQKQLGWAVALTQELQEAKHDAERYRKALCEIKNQTGELEAFEMAKKALEAL